jgi:hypothetical protein
MSKNILTLSSALASVEEALDEQLDGEEMTDELNGALACLRALIQGEANTFDGKPIYDRALVGVELA